jgi:hypothetical protein
VFDSLFRSVDSVPETKKPPQPSCSFAIVQKFSSKAFKMELPHMGQHCSEQNCKQLDYLPMKCDACSQAGIEHNRSINPKTEFDDFVSVLFHICVDQYLYRQDSVSRQSRIQAMYYKFFCLLLFEGTFTTFSKLKSQKEVTKEQDSRFFLPFLLGDRRIRIRPEPYPDPNL